ncbi:MAG: alkaline phosphatase [bacterium]
MLLPKATLNRLVCLAALAALCFAGCSVAGPAAGNQPWPEGSNPSAAHLGTRAGSLILFIGDGMGPGIVSLAKVYSDKALEVELNMVALAATGRLGMATTYSNNKLVTDSAAGATALATGSKTNNGMVGIAADGSRLENLFEKALRAGKSVGVVTTTAVTDATPAGFLAHSSSRDAEFNIATQIVEGGASVVMGGGSAYFLPAGLPEGQGLRSDGRDLTEEARDRGFDVARDKEGLRAAEGTKILGLFATQDIPFEGDRRDFETPSLSDMFKAALRVLTADPDGFVLVVEGGRIDHAEHDNLLGVALGELLAFDAALGHAMDYQSSDSTLTIVVTADHDTGAPALTATEKGYPPVEDAANLTAEGFGFVKWLSGSHTGTMVPVIARGPGEERFSGFKDNTDLNRAMVSVLGL